MIHELKEQAIEESTLVLTLRFFDEAHEQRTFTTLTWSLHNSDKEIVNEREDVELTPVGTLYTIVLTGDDLAIPSSDTRRKITLTGVYTSDLGEGLSFTAEIRFSIANVANVS